MMYFVGLCLLLAVVMASGVRFPANFARNSFSQSSSVASNGEDAKRHADILAQVQETSRSVKDTLIRGHRDLSCRISGMIPATKKFFSRDASCPYVDKGSSVKKVSILGVDSKNSTLSKTSGKKKVLILMSDTGGGHRASAQAIDRSLKEQFPGRIDVDIIDIWTTYARWPFNRFVPTYRYVAQRPMMWRGFYAYGHFPPTKLFTETWSWMSSYWSFKDAIVSRNPDMVVSVHPLCQLMPIWVVQQMNKIRDRSKPAIPFVTVVTDLGGAHNTWFDRRADAVFVPSDAVRKLAMKTRLRKDKVVQRGLPIRPSFWKRGQTKEVLRGSLGLLKGWKTILLMGGGDGVGGLGLIATEIATKCAENKDAETQMVVICGNNQKLKKELRDRSYPDNMKVVVRGFVENIHEYMGASDCIVTKAGPGTIAEAMTRGLPIVLSSYLPGQEAGNVPYVVEGGFGLYPGPRPKRIASTVSKLIIDDKRLATMSAKALAAARPEATQEIAKDIGNAVLNTKDKIVTAKYSDKL